MLYPACDSRGSECVTAGAVMLSSCRRSERSRGGGRSGERPPVFPTVETLLVGGGPMSPPLVRAVGNVFPSARIMTAYGEAPAPTGLLK